MFIPLPGPPYKRCARRISFSKSAALIILLTWLLVLDACSGFSVPPLAAALPPATNSTTALTISSTLPSATVGAAYSATLSVSGGTAPYLFSLASGQLPTSVALNANKGIFSGTPSTPGAFSFAVSVTDSKGISKQQALQITVANTPISNPGNTFSNLQQSAGWGEYGQGPPSFIDCSPSPCDGITYSMTQGIKSPSMSGSSTEYDLGGSAVYSDALFNNHLIGAFSSQGMPDTNQTLVPTYHTFTYDVYFYGTNLELSQAVEFDINQFFDNLGFIWGHECRIAGGHEWDVWNNVTAHWTPTGIPCYPLDNSWNHLTIKVQRTSSNQLLYQSITLNGVTNTLNQYYDPGTAVNWYGVTINYQMDGNYQQAPYTVYLDNLSFTYE